MPPGVLKWILLLFTIFQAGNLCAQAPQRYTVVFYNVENLYDTRDDSLTSDEEFTPGSARHWNRERFEHKINLIYKTLITAGNGQFPDIVGLAEIENFWVLEQLISKTPLSKVPYGIIHKESPDLRGIDVALIYRKDKVKPIDYEHISISENGSNNLLTRDILHYTAELAGEQIHFFVNHWPSRSGGYIETKSKRDLVAGILRKTIESLLAKKPAANILLMGDFNATPQEKCFTSILKALPYPGNGDPTYLINLSTTWTNREEGTIRTGGQWETFDQMICSSNLLKNGTLIFDEAKSGICSFDFLLEPDLTYMGRKPYRTYLGPKYHGGISDHLPVRISYLIK